MGIPFDRNGRERIKATVRAFEAGALTNNARRLGSRGAPISIHLVRATEFVLAGNVGAFQIRVPGGDKGEETDGPYEDIDCYVRKGLCFEDGIYTAVEMCGADDATFEIVDPTKSFTGVSQEVIAQDATGTIRFDPAEGSDTDVEVKAKFGDVESDTAVRCAFDELTEEWHATQTTCPA